jgi:hypothetical protein
MRKLLLVSMLTMLASAPVMAQSQYYPGGCARGYYKNAEGVCVQKPTYYRGGGATALCADGKYSYATRGPDVCANQHGGVVEWLR